MKTTRCLPILLLFCSSLSITAMAQQSTTPITELQFLDSKLSICVVETAIANGWSLVSEVTSLNCSNQGISSTQGIQQLTALKSLILTKNQLTTIDVSENNALDNLWLNQNQLSGINVSANTALNALVLSDNQLTEIDVSGNTNLQFLYLFKNQLTNLDVSANTQLTFLRLNQNKLTSIDVSANIALTSLWLFENQLTEIDVSTNTALNFLYLFDNQLTEIDVSNNPVLGQLLLNQNRLKVIDISANTVLTSLNLARNQLTAIDIGVNTALLLLDIRENPLSPTAREQLNAVAGDSLRVAQGYDASFSMDSGVLTIPAVRFGEVFFRVELNLIDPVTNTFELAHAEEIVAPNIADTAEFGFDKLVVTDVQVQVKLGAVQHYRLELELAASSPVATFVLTRAEQLL